MTRAERPESHELSWMRRVRALPFPERLDLMRTAREMADRSGLPVRAKTLVLRHYRLVLAKKALR